MFFGPAGPETRLMTSTCIAEDAVYADDISPLADSFGPLDVALDDRACLRLFRKLDGLEIGLVRQVVSWSSRTRLQTLTRIVTLLGNGWIYPLIALLLVYLQPHSAWRLLIAGGSSATLCFAIYPSLKRRLGRLRPFHVDTSIEATSPPLDFYSCPSGHTMAATAVAIPLAVSFPHTLITILAGWLLIAWSRVSSGHHFPTDVVVGTLIGSAIASPISWLLL